MPINFFVRRTNRSPAKQLHDRRDDDVELRIRKNSYSILNDGFVGGENAVGSKIAFYFQ